MFFDLTEDRSSQVRTRHGTTDSKPQKMENTCLQIMETLLQGRPRDNITTCKVSFVLSYHYEKSLSFQLTRTKFWLNAVITQSHIWNTPALCCQTVEKLKFRHLEAILHHSRSLPYSKTKFTRRVTSHSL
jgi:hypothetical protein